MKSSKYSRDGNLFMRNFSSRFVSFELWCNRMGNRYAGRLREQESHEACTSHNYLNHTLRRSHVWLWKAGQSLLRLPSRSLQTSQLVLKMQNYARTEAQNFSISRGKIFQVSSVVHQNPFVRLPLKLSSDRKSFCVRHHPTSVVCFN